MSPVELAIAKEHYEKWSSNVLLRKLITEDEHFLWDFVPAALDEIERLRADVDSLTTALASSGKTIIISSEAQAKRIAELEENFKDMRANKDNAEAHIEDLRKLNDDLMANCNSLRSRAQKAEARVAELEALLGTAERDKQWLGEKFGAKIQQQRAALKVLGKRSGQRGKVLVEERARGDYFDESQDSEGYWWDRKNTTDYTQNEYRKRARSQLHWEGLL